MLLTLREDRREIASTAFKTAQLGYTLMGPAGSLYEGVSKVQVQTDSAQSTLQIANPKQVAARSIHLYLAR